MSGLVSTRDSERKEVSYLDALLEGLAPDGGLYVPTEYPQIPLKELGLLRWGPYVEIVLEIKKRLVADGIPDADFMALITRAYSPDKFKSMHGNIVPTRPIGKDLFVQNLSLGPTAAFKDMALQLLGQELNYELGRRDKNLLILGATSGDTGSSAEAALKGLDRITLFMLSPAEGMSEFQKKQMGALSGGNIFNVSIEGRFDDCQDLVKEMKKDPEFAMAGAVNSINWGRIASQVPYFVSGYLQVVKEVGEPVDFVVPTGNFGNVLSGYVAKMMGVPIRKLVVATNENDVMARLIRTGFYDPKGMKVTSSPSMDITKASNYERLAHDILDRDPVMVQLYMEEFSRHGRVCLDDYGSGPEAFAERGFFQGTSTHQDRLETIRRVYSDTKIIIDPHTADGVTVAYKTKEDDGVPMIAMETALPVKFENTIREALGFIPLQDERFGWVSSASNDEGFYKMKPDVEELKSHIRRCIEPQKMKKMKMA